MGECVVVFSPLVRDTELGEQEEGCRCRWPALRLGHTFWHALSALGTSRLAGPSRAQVEHAHRATRRQPYCARHFARPPAPLQRRLGSLLGFINCLVVVASPSPSNDGLHNDDERATAEPETEE